MRVRRAGGRYSRLALRFERGNPVYSELVSTPGLSAIATIDRRTGKIVSVRLRGPGESGVDGGHRGIGPFLRWRLGYRRRTRPAQRAGARLMAPLHERAALSLGGPP
jgi:hypothetical protein